MKDKILNLKSENNRKKGITLFIAIVVMSILLIISFAVINIAIKGTQFATMGRDSQFAFYAADAGLECALYWDSKYNAFSTSSPGVLEIECNNQTISTGSEISGTSTLARIGGGGSSNPASIFGFSIDEDLNLDSCVVVTVTKNTDGSTYIKSRGYNTCDIYNNRRIERGIEITEY